MIISQYYDDFYIVTEVVLLLWEHMIHDGDVMVV